MGKILAIVAVLAGILVLTISADRPQPPADFTYIEPVDLNTLDAQRMSYLQDFRLAYAIFEGLVRWDTHSTDFHVVPACARRWEISEDRLVYTFHLEPSAKWSTGDAVTAEHFVRSWQRAILPDTAADYSKLFFCIKGAQAFFEWRTAQLAAYAARPASERTHEAALALRAEADARFRDTVGLEALDPLTLRVTLERPTPYFLDLAAFGPFLPVHIPTVERSVSVDASSGAIKQGHAWTKPPTLPCNGPYVLTQWRFKRDLRLERNPMYWNPALAKSDSIRVVFVEDQNTAVLAFTSGAGQWHSDVEVEYIGDLLAQKARGERDDVHALGTFGTYFWSFNCTPTLTGGRANPFYDARVRRAFALALNKQQLVEKVRRTNEKVADVLIPPGAIHGFKSPRGLSFDPDRARRELHSAGWIDRDNDGVPENDAGEPFPVVDLLCTSVGPHKDMALAMGRMWEEVLGVRSRVQVRETKVYRNTLDTRDYMMARGGWYGDFYDPVTFLDLHKTGDGNNDRGFSDPAYDAILDAAQNEPDPDKRMRLLEEAERYTMDEALPVLPIFQYDQFYLFKPPMKPDGSPNRGGLANLSTHPRLVQYLWDLAVVKDVPPRPPFSAGIASAEGEGDVAERGRAR